MMARSNDYRVQCKVINENSKMLYWESGTERIRRQDGSSIYAEFYVYTTASMSTNGPI